MAWALEPDSRFQRNTWRQHLGVVIPILAIYFFLAFYRIDHQSLWVDEVLSAKRVESNEPFLASGRWFGGRGPLYFALLQLWGRWGSSELALRSLSAVLGGVTICLGYLAALRLGGRRVAQLSALLLATSPFLIWYSQEARYVMLMITTALAAMYTFHLALPAKRPGWWLLYVGSLTLAIAAFVVNIALPILQGVYLLCSPARRASLRPWLLCQLVVFALFIWWANDGHIGRVGGYWQRLTAQVTTAHKVKNAAAPVKPIVTGGSREFTAMALPYTFFAFSIGFSLGPSVAELHVSRSLATLLPHALILTISALLFGGLTIVGLANLWHAPDTAKLLTLWLAVPIILALSVSAIMPQMAYNVRYVAMSLPVYLLILATGIASFRRPAVQLILLAAVLLLNGLSLANYYYNPRYSREDARSAARFLEGAARAGDIIVVVGHATPLKYYYTGDVPLVSWGKERMRDRPALTDDLRELSREHDRIWLVMTRHWEANPRDRVKAALGDRYTLVQQQQFSGVDIYAYRVQ